jgi:cation:H+ antiporter
VSPQIAAGAGLLGAVVLVFVSSELFVNAVEWLGRQWGVGQAAVGTVLAAIGTSVPENLITIAALVFTGGSAGHALGVGAILGAPLVLSTVAFAVLGLSVLLSHRRRQHGRVVALDNEKVRSDLLWFMGIFGSAMVASQLPQQRWLRLMVATALVLAWLLYVLRSLRWAEQHEEELAPLHFHRSAPRQPHRTRVLAQAVVGVAGMLLGAQLFVASLLGASRALALDATLTALLLAPVATELPEIFNTVVWVRRGDEALAVGNIAGAMLVQSALPCALGLALTSWVLSGPAYWSGFFTLLAAMWLRWRLGGRRPGWQLWELISAALFYAGFVLAARTGG